MESIGNPLVYQNQSLRGLFAILIFPSFHFVRSSDMGDSWLQMDAIPSNSVSSASYNLENLVVASPGHPILQSKDNGASWSRSNSPANTWKSIVSSSTGQ
jgi:photosystem II stability/assembly factor-like uncharacterized protein